MKRLFTICAVVLIAAACKKDKTGPAVQTDQEKQDLIVNKKWKIVEMTGKGDNGDTIPNQVPTAQPYELDDYTIWYSDFSWATYDNVVTHPNKTTNTLDTGSWLIYNSQLQVKDTGKSAQVRSFDITGVTKDLFTIKQYSPGNKMTIYLKFNVVN